MSRRRRRLGGVKRALLLGDQAPSPREVKDLGRVLKAYDISYVLSVELHPYICRELPMGSVFLSIEAEEGLFSTLDLDFLVLVSGDPMKYATWIDQARRNNTPVISIVDDGTKEII